MAILEDPAVLSKLQRTRKEMPLSSSLSDIHFVDLVAKRTTKVAVRWTSTNYKETVEASTIRFRDLEAEGRGSARGGRRARRRPVAPRPVAPTPRSPRKGKTVVKKVTPVQKVVPVKKIAPVEQVAPEGKNRRELGQPGAVRKRPPSTNSSIVTAEGRDDDSSWNSRQLSSIGTFKESVAAAEDKSIGSSGSDSLLQVLKNQNPIDLHDDDFDSSDDEAVSERMRIKRERNETLGMKQEHSSLGSSFSASEASSTLSKKRRRVEQTNNSSSAASEKSNGDKFERNTKKRATDSSCRSSVDGDIDYNGFGSDSFSCPTEESSKKSGGKQQQQYPNGYDSGEEDEDGIVPAENGQTNMTNWMKMKRFFTNFV